MPLSFKLLNTFSSTLTYSRSVYLAPTWFLVGKGFARTLLFTYTLYLRLTPTRTVPIRLLVALVCSCGSRTLQPKAMILFYVMSIPSVRISTLTGTVTFTYPMTSIVARTCNTSSLPSQNFSWRCRTYFSCAKVVQAVYGKYLYALSRITRRYSVT